MPGSAASSICCSTSETMRPMRWRATTSSCVSMVIAGLSGLVANQFDVVAVRVDDEGRVVVRVVLRPQARPAVVLAARLQRRAMEVVDLLAVPGPERDMEVR